MDKDMQEMVDSLADEGVFISAAELREIIEAVKVAMETYHEPEHATILGPIRANWRYN